MGERITEGFNAANMTELWRTTVGAFNWYSRELPGWVYTATMIVALFLMMGAFTKTCSGVEMKCRAVLVLCLCALLAQVLIIGLRGVAAGRYLFPILPALATLLAVGAGALTTERARQRIVSGVVIAFIAFDAVFLWRGLLVEQYLVWGN